jgi:phosphoserine aminotransferase
LLLDRKLPLIGLYEIFPLVLTRSYRWSTKASQEAVRLLGSKYVNVALDAKAANDGKFGKIPDESTWKLSSKPAMVYLCENEVYNTLYFPVNTFY